MSALFLKRTLCYSGWGVAYLASLRIANLPGNWGHGICGPWGCGPPIQALVANHLSWLVLLFPAAALVARRVPPRMSRLLGGILVAVGIAFVLTIVIHERTTWWEQVNERFRVYFWQRVGFQFATEVDFPGIQLLLAGAVLVLWPRKEIARGTASSDQESSETVASPDTVLAETRLVDIASREIVN